MRSEEPIIFIRTYGGNDADIGYSVLQTPDEGYVICGITYSYGAGDADVWLIKTDEYGNEEWNRTYGGEHDDYAYNIIQTADGGFIIAGDTHSVENDGVQLENNPNSDAWVIKTNGLGVEEWNRTFYGPFWDYGYSIVQTTDGGYMLLANYALLGMDYYNLWLIRLDGNGTALWNKTIGGNNNCIGYSVQLIDDGGFVIAGEKSKFVSNASGANSFFELSDAWLLKVDRNGTEEWNRTFGGIEEDIAYSVCKTNDSGYMIAGHNGSSGIWLIKTNETGREEWNASYENYYDSFALSVKETRDGGYIMTGQGIPTCDYSKKIWLIKTNSTGGMEWDRFIGSGPESMGFSVAETVDGGFIATGADGLYNSDIILIKTDADGDIPTVNKPPRIAIDHYRKIDGETVILLGQATDPDGTIEKIEVWVDSGKPTLINGTGKWTYNWDISSLNAGKHTIYFRAYDDRSLTVVVNLTIDIPDESIQRTDRSPDVEWFRTFGGDWTDFTRGIVITEDSGFVMTGGTYNYNYNCNKGYYNAMIILKTDSRGSLVWRRNFTIDNYGGFHSLQPTKGGGYILAGTEANWTGYGIESNAWLMMIDKNGNEVWNRTYNFSINDNLRFIRQTADSGFIAVGSNFDQELWQYNVLMLKTDSFGNQEWNRTFKDSFSSRGNSVLQTSDGGYLLTGGNEDIWLIKTDEKGIDEWNRSYGGLSSDVGNDIIETSDGGYVIVGLTHSYREPVSDQDYSWNRDIILIKIDADGDLVWQRVFDSGDEDYGRSVRQTHDGGYIIIGTSHLQGNPNQDVLVIKTNSKGTLMWNKSIGGLASDDADVIEQTEDEGFIIGGASESYSPGDLDMFLIKLRPESSVNHTNIPPECAIDRPGELEIVSGIVEVSGNASDIDGGIESVEIKFDDGPWINVNGTSHWYLFWDTTKSSNGEHKISVRAFDGESYSVFNNSFIIIYVDNEPEPEENDGIEPAWFWVMLYIMAAAVVIFVIVLFLQIRKPSGPAQTGDPREQIPNIPTNRLTK